METLEDRRVLSGYGAGFTLFTDSTLTNGGLVGSYVNESLQAVDEMDWRESQFISGTRVDPVLFSVDRSFGNRGEVGITGGTDEDWDLFSVQWDGVVEIQKAGIQLATRSGNGSRMWIDVDENGEFDAAELVNNNWGKHQDLQIGELSDPLDVGTYEVRIQYEERTDDNGFSLIADPINAQPIYDLYTDASLTTEGLVGSYVDRSLRETRLSQTA